MDLVRRIENKHGGSAMDDRAGCGLCGGRGMRIISGAYMPIRWDSVLDDWKVPVITRMGHRTWMYPNGKIPHGWKTLWRIGQ